MSKKPTILIVEDNVDLRFLYSQVMKNEGLEAREAADGQAALKELNSDSVPDLVLLDLSIPKVSGHEVIQAIRNSPKISAMPIVVMSGWHNATELLKHDLVQAVCTKPVECDELINTILKYLPAQHPAQVAKAV